MGYTLFRQLLSLGHDCQVVAPSLIPKKPGERIKTDWLEAIKYEQHFLQIVLQEYIDAVKVATQRVADMTN